jgi:hypothetical protein
MSDVITTKRINGYRLSIVLDSVGNGLYIYSVWLDVPYEARSMPCYIDEHVFDSEPTRKHLESLAKAKMRELQKTLTALINALPDAESVRNGVHEL